MVRIGKLSSVIKTIFFATSLFLFMGNNWKAMAAEDAEGYRSLKDNITRLLKETETKEAKTSEHNVMIARGLLNAAERSLEEKDFDRAAICLKKATAKLKNEENFSIGLMSWSYSSDGTKKYFYDAPDNKKHLIFLPITHIYAIPLYEKRRGVYKQTAADNLSTIGFLHLEDLSWAEPHPEEVLNCYLLTEKTKANGKDLIIRLITEGDSFRLNRVHKPSDWWYVYDKTENKKLSPQDWEFVSPNEVHVKNTVVNHSYQVLYLIDYFSYSGVLEGSTIDPDDPLAKNVVEYAYHEKKIFHTNPLFPDFQDHMLERLDKLLKNWSGYVDILALYAYLPYPAFLGTYGRKGWDEWSWFGYGLGVNPWVQQKFAETTGMKFDPEWLIYGDNYTGSIGYPPSPGYLKWREFIHKEIVSWAKKVAEVCYKNGVELQFNIGDMWIGIQPSQGDVKEIGYYSVCTYMGGPVKTRMLTDFPGPAKREIKIWIPSYSKEDLSAEWPDVKRSLLFQMADSLRWEVAWAIDDENSKDPKKQEEMKKTVTEITDDFLLTRSQLLGKKVFTHDLTVYILDCWGKEYEWTGFSSEAGMQEAGIVLTHLIDLPIKVKWLSLRELSEKGIPSDCDVILNYGRGDTASSGGYMWELPNVVNRIGEFVQKGGGFIGIGAPSYHNNKLYLSNLLGLNYVGEDKSDQMVKSDQDNWITKGLIGSFSSLATNDKVVAVNPDVKVLYSKDGKSTSSPVVTVREYGKGRVAYLSSYGASPDYRELIRRTIFWTAQKENLLSKLYTDTPNVFVYLYPEINTFVLYNMNGAQKTAEVKLDVSLLNISPEQDCTLYDRVKGELIAKTTVKELRGGYTFSLAPRETRFVEVKTFK